MAAARLLRDDGAELATLSWVDFFDESRLPVLIGPPARELGAGARPVRVTPASYVVCVGETLIDPTWDDPVLRVASDDVRTARYRLLQSWYRECVLAARPGPRPGGSRARGPDGERRLVGSMLATEEVDQRPGLNFVTDAAAGHAWVRADEVRSEGGTLDPQRLLHNMLSSMPMCFNVFGSLREEPAFVELVRLFDPDATAVEQVDCEVRPTASLGDRTAFDAVVTYRGVGGGQRLLGVETKYTEAFSPKSYDNDRYRQVTADCGWFSSDAAPTLLGSATNQLWRTLLLGAVTEKDLRLDQVRVGVLTTADDRAAATAVATTHRVLQQPERLVHLSLEDLVTAARASNDPGLAEWAGMFERRYLDLTPIEWLP